MTRSRSNPTALAVGATQQNQKEEDVPASRQVQVPQYPSALTYEQVIAAAVDRNLGRFTSEVDVRVFRSMVDAWLKIHGLSHNSPVGPELLIGLKTTLHQAADKLGALRGWASASSKRNFKSQINRLSQVYHKACELQPASFEKAFRTALARLHPDIDTALKALRTRLPRAERRVVARNAQRWLAGALPGSSSQRATVKALEAICKVEPNFLTQFVEGIALDRHGSARGVKQLWSKYGITPSVRPIFGFHLPADFHERSEAEQSEIVGWFKTHVANEDIDYTQFQRAVKADGPYALWLGPYYDHPRTMKPAAMLQLTPGIPANAAPESLRQEVRDLVQFKTADFPSIRSDTGTLYNRESVWDTATVDITISSLGRFFGALALAEDASDQGSGVPPDALCLALVAVPAAIESYLAWSLRRRTRLGSERGTPRYTRSDLNVLSKLSALVRPKVGWVWQNPRLATALTPIGGLLPQSTIDHMKTNWEQACAAAHSFLRQRERQVNEPVEVHKDPFEPILSVLESPNPLAVYAKFPAQILKYRPDRKSAPQAWASHTRGFIFVALGLQIPLRSANFAELLFQPPGTPPTDAKRLSRLQRCEIHFADGQWVFVGPASAFKNEESSFWGSGTKESRCVRLPLKDIGGLYKELSNYVSIGRELLWPGITDSGSAILFVRNRAICRKNLRDPGFTPDALEKFYKNLTRRYAVRNPWTGVGAIDGICSHGPHRRRDIVATTVLKLTKSYERAAWAIFDTEHTVRKAYARFLPSDKVLDASDVIGQALGWTPGESSDEPAS